MKLIEYCYICIIYDHIGMLNSAAANHWFVSIYTYMLNIYYNFGHGQKHTY